jgi:hypothetical protein
VFKQYVVTPVQEKQLQQWERVYGRTHLPIKYPHPHLACTQRWGDVPVYYLDTTAVPTALLDRLAAFEVRRMGMSYGEARTAVHREWLIRADECKMETIHQSASSSWQPAFDFLRHVPSRAHPTSRRLSPAL